MPKTTITIQASGVKTFQAIAGKFQMLQAPKLCTKCKKKSFDKIDWPNEDGTTNSVFFCSGCGMVYDPVKVELKSVFSSNEFAEYLKKMLDSGEWRTRDVIWNGNEAKLGTFLDNPWRVKVKR